MGLFFQVLASGSRGNMIYVGTSRTRILVDAGLTGRTACRLLEGTPGGLGHLDALLISHEHSDHVSGAGVISRRFALPVYLTQGTWKHLPARIGELAGVQPVRPGTSFTIGDLQITAFTVSHDGAQPVGFVIEHEGYRLGICTDLGKVTGTVKRYLQGCHALVLESNHDVYRLMHGPYPHFLIDRIKSPLGHLDNSRARDLLRLLHHPGLRWAVLAHVSETNNCPEWVEECIQPLQRLPEWENVRFEIATQSNGAPGIDIA